MRALVTGSTGFAGGHLSRYLASKGWEVWGCSSRPLPSGSDGPERYLAADLTEAEAADEVVQRACPDAIFHLAARAAVAPSHQHPWETLNTNLAMQTRVLEAVRHHRPDCAVLVVGSGEEYGLAPAEAMPLRESSPLRPLSPYAVSKVGQDFLGLQYHLAYGLHIVRVRPFNHIGPGQGLGFVAADFARQLAAAELGLAPAVISVGNLDAERDFTDVRDVVRAYVLLLQAAPWGEVFNVASGRALSVGRLLDMLLAQCRVPVRVVPDPARMRPSDIPVFVGAYDRLQTATGWRPEIPLEQTVSDLMEYWRRKLADGETN